MGKIVLITGANKGLGYHLARFLLGNAPEFDKKKLSLKFTN